MQPVLNVQDIRRVETALTRAGVSVSELMRRAGSACAQEIMALNDCSSVVVLTGFGNNGGDGWVCAEELFASGKQVVVVTPCAPEDIATDLARVAAKSAIDAGVPVVIGPPKHELEELIDAADLVLDSMLGIGLRGAPSAPFDIWINTLNESGTRVISVDVPSGLSAQTGHSAGACVWADMTVTMLALKPGLLADEGRDACGVIIVAPLAEQTEELVLDADPVAWRLEPVDYVEVVPASSCVVDKRSRGSVLVVAGSTRYPGAAVLAARAAARSGAGYVTLAVPAPIVHICQQHLLEIPVVGIDAEIEGTFSAEGKETILALAARHNVVVAGPGMRVNASTVAICSALIEADVPLVLDADALNCLARLTANRLDTFPELIRRAQPLVLTPHYRELGRLMGLPDTPPNSLTSALEAARRIVWADGGSELVIVAKGTATACISVDSALLPKPGPASLATAGTGDVLSGLIAAQLARRCPLEGSDVARICAFAAEVHGQAASLAEESFGSCGVMAHDVVECLGRACDAMEQHAAMDAAMQG